MLKKIISILIACATVAITTIPVFAEEQEKDIYDNYFVYSVSSESANNPMLAGIANMSYEDVTELLIIKEKVLQVSTKLNFSYNKSAGKEDFSVSQFKTSAEQGYAFLEKINAGEPGQIISELYIAYKAQYLSPSALAAGFVTFYSYALNSEYYKNLCDALAIYNDEILSPILNEYCYSPAAIQSMEQSSYRGGDGESLNLLIDICKHNSEKDIPQSIKDLYALLAGHYEKMQRGVYSKDILVLFEKDKISLKGRMEICEEINKYSEYCYFKEYCENFRYIATPVMAKGMKQEDILTIISKLSENSLSYKENIELKYEYYSLLCDIVYFQNDNLPEVQLDSEREAFITRRNAIEAYYNDIYNNYNNPVFMGTSIETDILNLNNRIILLYPTADTGDLIKYTSSRTADGYAYNPIQISSDNMFFAYVFLILIVGALIIVVAAVVKVAIAKAKDIPRIF